jgi:hypothetical protein
MQVVLKGTKMQVKMTVKMTMYGGIKKRLGKILMKVGRVDVTVWSA